MVDRNDLYRSNVTSDDTKFSETRRCAGSSRVRDVCYGKEGRHAGEERVRRPSSRFLTRTSTQAVGLDAV